jgi:hypothetical protein
VRHLRPILCPTVLQRRHQRPIRCAIREIEPCNAEDGNPGGVAEIDRKPPITREADDHQWPDTGCDLQWVDALDGSPDDLLVRPVEPDGDRSPGGAVTLGGLRRRSAHAHIYGSVRPMSSFRR